MTFARGATPRDLPGVRVDRGSERGLSAGRTSALASYDPLRPLPASFGSHLHGVSRISLVHAGSATSSASDYRLHTLTIHATTARGTRVGVASVLLENVDDGRLFFSFASFAFLVNGQWKVQVPSGHYLLVVSTLPRLGHLVTHQVTVGSHDVIDSVTLAEARVRPTMQAPPGFTPYRQEFTLDALDKARRVPTGIAVSGLLPWVSPVRHMKVGSLSSEVYTLWTPRGYRRKQSLRRLAAARVAFGAIPRHLDVPFRADRYAHVTYRHYATGPAVRSVDTFGSLTKGDGGANLDAFPTPRPGVVRARLLGGRSVTWVSTSAFGAHTADELHEERPFGRGQHVVVPYFRGPVTPVADLGTARPVDVTAMTRRCQLCLTRSGVLNGDLAMASSAGTTQAGETGSGRYALYRGASVIDQGTGQLSPHAVGVTAGERLRMVASIATHGKQDLSRRVDDVWRFRAPESGHGVVPILRAAYVPPTTLDSVGRRGRVSYPVTFDNLGRTAAKIARASVRWSTDGDHWHAAHLQRQDKDTFQVSYRNPASSRGHRFLSLRVFARDVAGRTVSESVQNAYALPRSTPGAFRSAHPCGRPTTSHFTCFVQHTSIGRSQGRDSEAAPEGWGAGDLRSAYMIGGAAPHTETIAVIDAYDYPHAEADMNAYRAQYGLPPCTTAGGCFEKLNQHGEQGSYPKPDAGWGIETALDLQMVSAACPTCHVILVEADNDGHALTAAEETAVQAGATVTSHSFGIMESHGVRKEASTYNHPGVTAVASTGDDGYGVPNFPASAPRVLAVGGTVLSRSSDPRGWSETAWSHAASGCSAYFGKPAGQDDAACSGRTVADISAVAQDVAIYDTSLPRADRGWFTVDGTSASAPLIAGMVANVGGSGIRPADLYAEDQGNGAADFNDIASGSNGFCRRSYLCTGVPGYDGPTGLGSPHTQEIFAIRAPR